MAQAHVAIEQTAIGLKRRGFQVHVVADATMSRGYEDRALAFKVIPVSLINSLD